MNGLVNGAFHSVHPEGGRHNRARNVCRPPLSWHLLVSGRDMEFSFMAWPSGDRKAWERRPGIEPGSPAWHAGILPLKYRRRGSGQPDSNRHRRAWKARMRPSQRARNSSFGVVQLGVRGGPVGIRTPISTVQAWCPAVGRPAPTALPAGSEGIEPSRTGVGSPAAAMAYAPDRNEAVPRGERRESNPPPHGHDVSSSRTSTLTEGRCRCATLQSWTALCGSGGGTRTLTRSVNGRLPFPWATPK